MARLLENLVNMIPQYTLRTLLVGTTLFACSLSALKMLDEKKPVLFYDFDNNGKNDAVVLEERDGVIEKFSVAESYSIDPLTGRVVAYGKRTSLGAVYADLVNGERKYSIEKIDGELKFIVKGINGKVTTAAGFKVVYPKEQEYGISFSYRESE